MKKTTTLASLLLAMSFIAACNPRHQLNCNGEIGELHEALKDKDPAKALAIIASSSNLDAGATCPAHKINTLVQAAGLGYTAVVIKLLEKGTDIDKQDINGSTALMYAALNGHIPVVKLLLQRGADVDKQDKSGETALSLVAWYGNLPVVKLLLQRGADLDKQNKSGGTALMWAIKSDSVKGNIPLIKMLIDSPQDFLLTNNIGETTLEMAEQMFKHAKPADKKYYSLVIAMLKKKMRH